MRQRVLWVAVALVACLSGGCGTFAAHCGKDGYTPYGGVRADVDGIRSGIESVIGESSEDAKDRRLAVGFLLLAVFDLPFSAFADTLYLPETLSNRR